MESKKDIRKRVLSARNHMNQIEWEAKSCSIANKVVTHSIFLEADSILCYMDYKNEAGTRQIIEKAWELRKKVYAPKVESELMNFYQITSFGEVAVGYKDILEPAAIHKFNEEKGAVIMPGVAFDTNRNRIGYGKGYYDKYLEEHPFLKTIAIAFQMQIVDDISCDEHDKRPDVLITEENIYV